MPKLDPIPNLQVFADSDALAHAAAVHVSLSARDSISARGRFTLALAGGSTPEKTYKLLAGPEFVKEIYWDRVFLFFGDERFVSLTDADRSNYDLARRTLLNAVPVPHDQVFPVDTALPNADDAARAYELTISDALMADTDPISGLPVFDLILLGLGDDGHTLSLFPHAAALTRNDALVVSSPPGTLPPPVDRITLTFPVVNAAREALFLVAGAKKAEALQDILENQPTRDDRPAAAVTLPNGTVTYFVDEAAAGNLGPATRQRKAD
jgi:6-phosphogluconolactonase